MLPPAWEHEFQGSEGSRIIQKAIKNVTENSLRRQAASKSVLGGSWRPFGLHVGARGNIVFETNDVENAEKKSGNKSCG